MAVSTGKLSRRAKARAAAMAEVAEQAKSRPTGIAATLLKSMAAKSVKSRPTQADREAKALARANRAALRREAQADRAEARAQAKLERQADREAKRAATGKSGGRLTEIGLIARYPHVIPGTLQYEEDGKWAHKQTVEIATVGLDGMPDGNRRRVATSDLFQIRHMPGVARKARKAGQNGSKPE